MADDTRMDDPTLIARLRDPAQCRAAFGEVIALYQQPLYWQIRRMVENHEDANDLLQNTFLKAWDNIENFRGEAKLSTWLHKIAINESITFLARERKRLHISLDDEESHLVNLIEADTNIDGDELALRLRKAIASLPEKQRLVFNMRYFDEMKYEQMSEFLGTSVGALKASYHHAAKKIEQYFADGD
ncbi:RNA polymerase sigma factor [Muribaculum intestinale]|uniref:RNA polymerase sigma factor n=1 Tax=Muribaculum intestinale TaxID=1796646 RepID=UPI0025A65504|nr:RNA polymerase sigma factor [Muribaculum intestinale]